MYHLFVGLTNRTIFASSVCVHCSHTYEYLNCLQYVNLLIT